MKVTYVGLKAVKEDNVAGTGVVWLGKGDVQTVPDAAWLRMSRHPDVWRLADDRAAPPSPPAVLLQGTVPIEGLGAANLEAPAPQFFGVSDPSPTAEMGTPEERPEAPTPAELVQATAAAAPGAEGALPPTPPSGPAAHFVIEMPGDHGLEQVVLDTMDDVGLKAFATRLEKEARLNIDLRKKGDKMREAIVFAWNEMLAEAQKA